MSLQEEINRDIQDASPALHAALSELGLRAAFPPDIPFQAAEARGKGFNATIGQITDGAGNAVPLPEMGRHLTSLEGGDRNRALLYSPVEGVDELRHRWRRWQRRGLSDDQPSSLPLVTVGLTHGLSLVADLFAGPGRAVGVPRPFWGNYRQTFATRTGARLVSAPAYVDERFHVEAWAEALAAEPPGEPAVALVNLPSNPGGYSPTEDERARLIASLVEIAEGRPLVVVCDDAYAGLVYEEEIPRHSLFWDLLDRHSNLVPIKVDGATKEFSFFGGRVGFVTFPFSPESAAARALESKVKCLTRAALGSPVATTQQLLLQALRLESIADQVEAVRRLLEGRSRRLAAALAGLDRGLIRPQPFNSGCFALLQLAPGLGLEAEAVRRRLLDAHDTGVIAIAPDFVRIAFCSVAEDALPEVVRRIELAVAELSAERAGLRPVRPEE